MVQTVDVPVMPAIPQSSPFVELQQSLASRVEEISPFVNQLMEFITPLNGGFPCKEGPEVDVEISLREAVANAVIHGNHENPQKRVYVTCHCSTVGEVSLTIRDEGQGFDPFALPDPTDQRNILLTHGRGILLMQALMDDVTFEENGTVVRMRKRLRGTVE
jgi:serine/threonine-protein kinase RsbW